MPTATSTRKTPEASQVSPALSATRSVLGKLNVDLSTLQPVGAIPIYDTDRWIYVYNKHGIAPGVENMADPVKVEQLRRSAAAIVNAFPETIEHLVKMGYKQVRTLLVKPVKTREQVIAWAESIFNWGPGVVSAKPVVDAILLAPQDFQPVHEFDGDPVVVVPDGPLGNGSTKVRVIDAHPDSSWAKDIAKGKEVILGPRHEISKAAYAGQQNGATEATEAPQAAATATKATKTPATAKKATKSPTAAPTGRPRGRPRADGLVPGSPEAKEADAAKKKSARTTANKVAARRIGPSDATKTAAAEKAPAKKIIRRAAAKS